MVKRIVICCDGTWNTPNQPNPTNVVHFARAVLPTGSDGMAQVVFYDLGVGTDSGWWARITGGALGKGLDKNIEDGYRFLAHNYEPNDQIYLSGLAVALTPHEAWPASFATADFCARSISANSRKLLPYINAETATPILMRQSNSAPIFPKKLGLNSSAFGTPWEHWVYPWVDRASPKRVINSTTWI